MKTQKHTLLGGMLLLLMASFQLTGCKEKDQEVLSSEKSIEEYYFLKQYNPGMDRERIDGVIDESTQTIRVEIEQRGLDISNLKASFKVSDWSSIAIGTISQESGQTINDFNQPLTYTLRAMDGTTKDYTVEVTVPLYDGSSLLDMKLLQIHNESLNSDCTGQINEETRTVTFDVPYETDLSALRFSFELSPKATAAIGSVIQESGVTENDFSESNTKTFTVTSEDQEHTTDYTIVVNKETSRTYYFTSQADVDNFDPVVPIKNVVFTGPGITNEVMCSFAQRQFDIGNNIELDNTGITDLGFIQYLKDPDLGYVIRNHSQFVDLDEIWRVTVFKGDFIIEDNTPAFKIKQGYLEQVTEIAGDLRIRATDIESQLLSGCRRIGGNVHLEIVGTPTGECWILFGGWSGAKLETIGGDLYIANFPKLGSLGGLEALTSIGGNVTITGNSGEYSEMETNPNGWALVKKWVETGVVKPGASLTLVRADGSKVDLDNY